MHPSRSGVWHDSWLTFVSLADIQLVVGIGMHSSWCQLFCTPTGYKVWTETNDSPAASAPTVDSAIPTLQLNAQVLFFEMASSNDLTKSVPVEVRFTRGRHFSACGLTFVLQATAHPSHHAGTHTKAGAAAGERLIIRYAFIDIDHQRCA